MMFKEGFIEALKRLPIAQVLNKKRSRISRNKNDYKIENNIHFVYFSVTFLKYLFKRKLLAIKLMDSVDSVW